MTSSKQAAVEPASHHTFGFPCLTQAFGVARLILLARRRNRTSPSFRAIVWNVVLSMKVAAIRSCKSRVGFSANMVLFAPIRAQA
jgi:hypothetical protein